MERSLVKRNICLATKAVYPKIHHTIALCVEWILNLNVCTWVIRSCDSVVLQLRKRGWTCIEHRNAGCDSVVLQLRKGGSHHKSHIIYASRCIEVARCIANLYQSILYADANWTCLKNISQCHPDLQVTCKSLIYDILQK